MLSHETVNGTIVCAFDQRDKLNAVISENVKKEIGKHFENSGTRLVLDLGNIAFIDSSGFGALLSILRKAKSNSGIFCICNISPDVMRLFKLLQLQNIFDIKDTREECIESVSDKSLF